MVPGHPDGVITVTFGQGRWFGRQASSSAPTPTSSESSLAATSSTGLKVNKTGEKHDLCVTKVHSMDQRGKMAQSDLAAQGSRSGNESLPGHEAMERAIIRTATVAKMQKEPDYAHEGHTLLKGGRRSGPKRRELLPRRLELHQHDKSSNAHPERLGHDDRPQLLRRLQRLRRQLLCGKQHRRHRPRAGQGRPQHAVAPHRHLLRRRPARTRAPTSSP